MYIGERPGAEWSGRGVQVQGVQVQGEKRARCHRGPQAGDTTAY